MRGFDPDSLKAEEVALLLEKLKVIEDREVAHYRKNRVVSYVPTKGLLRPEEKIIMTEPVSNENKDVQPAQSGLPAPVLPQVVVIVATILTVIAGAVLGLPAAGIAVPGVVTAIASVVVALGTALGVASPGLRKQQ